MQGLTAATDNGEIPTLPSGCVEWRRAGFADSRLAGSPPADVTAPGSLQQKQQLDAAMLARYARARLVGSFAMAPLILLAAFIASIWLPSASIALWTSLTLCAYALLGVVCFCFKTPGRIRLGLWTGLFVSTELLCGLSWIGLFALLSDVASPEATIFQLATLLVVVAASATLAASLPAAVMTATVPMALALVALFALRHETLYLALAGLAISIEIFFLSLSQRTCNASRSLLAHRVEQERMAAALAEAQARSDQSMRVADEANLARSRFLSTMNHELRTPLNAILGFSEVMASEVLGPLNNPLSKEYSGDIHRSGQHLLDLINEILDLSRIEAGRYDLNEESISMLEIAEDCIGMIQLRARAKTIRISQQFESSLPQVWADEKSIRQVILNLLSNAVKFTPQGGEILVKAGWTAGGGQYVSIKDNGPGIPEDEIPVVLSAFGQGSIAIKSAEQGTGLGLPIVQAILAKHDGQFILKSKLREGTEGIAILPAKRVLQSLPAVEETHAIQPRRRSFA